MLTKPELILRGLLSERMKRHWLLTWHEDKEITPGVPDASYVMLAPGHETGWLELKADNPTSGRKPSFHVEPSQHQWIQFHLGRVPIHFLVAVHDQWFFIDGRYHAKLSDKPSVADLEQIAIASFPGIKMAENSYLFSVATQRTRDV